MNTDDWSNQYAPNDTVSESEILLWPDIIFDEDFMKIELKKPCCIVKGLLDLSSRLIFGGGSKTYKTWAMLDLALSIAGEQLWWGFQTQKTAILYCNFELREYYMQQRVKAIHEAKNCPFGPLYYWNLRGFPIGNMGTFKDELLRNIEKAHAEIIFIDLFYKILGERDERISAEINAIMREFDDITRQTGVSVVCSAHFTKGNQYAKDPLDRISGGGSINRDPDNLITLTKHEVDGAFSVDFTNRDHAPIAPFVVEWKYPLLVRNDELDPEDIKKPSNAKYQKNGNGNHQEESKTAVVNLIREHDDEMTKKEVAELAQSNLNLSRTSVYKKLKELESDKKIFVSKLTGKVGLLP